MSRFALTRLAREDLRAIATYTERTFGRAQRMAYLKGLDEAFHMLARHPAAGKPCDEILPGYRKHRHGSHLLFYKTPHPEADVPIVRVLHMQMDPMLNLAP